MPRFAPRYPDELFRLIEKLDDEGLALAEAARVIADAAQGAGMTRPSPVHLRRLLSELREVRRDEREVRAAILAVAGRAATGRVFDAQTFDLPIERALERADVNARRRAKRS